MIVPFRDLMTGLVRPEVRDTPGIWVEPQRGHPPGAVRRRGQGSMSPDICLSFPHILIVSLYEDAISGHVYVSPLVIQTIYALRRLRYPRSFSVVCHVAVEDRGSWEFSRGPEYSTIR